LITFTSGISYIDSIFSEKNWTITLNAQIPVDFLTWDHNEYRIEIPLEIRFKDLKIITISKMSFRHIDRLMSFTCLMEASFDLKLADFDINIPEQFGPEIKVQFLQLILRRGK